MKTTPHMNVQRRLLTKNSHFAKRVDQTSELQKRWMRRQASSSLSLEVA